MKNGDILGHESMGEVVEGGGANKSPWAGDRVVVLFTIACGECSFCRRGFFSGCERTNPDKQNAAKLRGGSPAGLFGYSHVMPTGMLAEQHRKMAAPGTQKAS